jgi:hypothetical protein
MEEKFLWNLVGSLPLKFRLTSHHIHAMYAHARDSGKCEFVGAALNVLGSERSLEMDRSKSQRIIPNQLWLTLFLVLLFTGVFWRASGLPYRPLMTLFVVLGAGELFRQLLMCAPRD